MHTSMYPFVIQIIDICSQHLQIQGRIQIFPKVMRLSHQEQIPTIYLVIPPLLQFPSISVKKKHNQEFYTQPYAIQ